jgi:hypothetical protein
MAELNIPEPWLAFLRLLNSRAVDYLLIGGCAVTFHGYARPIGDLDVFVGTNPQTAEKLIGVLEDYGHGVEPLAWSLLQLPEKVIRIGQPPFAVTRFAPQDRFIQLGTAPTPIEIMTMISGVTFAGCYPAKVMALVDGIEVPVIGREHLRANKAASIREKDADDLAHLS